MSDFRDKRGPARSRREPLLPANIEAERSLLGAILLDSTLYAEAAALKPDDFFLDAHGRIYACILELSGANRPIDEITLSEELSRHRELEAIGGIAYLSSLTDGAPRRSSIEHYVRIVRGKALLRSLASRGEWLQLRACEPNADTNQILSEVSDFAESLRRDAGQEQDWRAIFHTWEEFENAPPLQFAIEFFSQEAGIGIIGALAGQGKTLVMLSMAEAMLNGTPLFGCDIFQVKQRAKRVLYLIPESSIGPFWARLKLFHLEEHIHTDRLLVRTLSSREQIPLGDSRILRAAEGADIFLDTAVRFMDGAENDAEPARAFAGTLFTLLAAGARSVTGAHHAPKGFEAQERMTLENILRGSGDIGAMLSTAWGLRQIDADSNRIYIENVKARDFQPCGPFVIEGRPHLDQTGRFRLVEAPGGTGELKDYLPARNRGGAPAMADKVEKVRQTIEMRGRGSSLQEIAGALGVSKSGVRKWLSEHDKSCTNPCAQFVHDAQGSIPAGGNGTKGSFPPAGGSCTNSKVLGVSAQCTAGEVDL